MHERLTGVILSAALHLGVVSFGAMALSHAEAAAPSPPRTSLTYVTMRSASPFVASGTTAASVPRAAPVPRPAFIPATFPPEEPAVIPPVDAETPPSVAPDVADLSTAGPARLEVAAAPPPVEDVPQPAALPVRVGAFERARAPQATVQARGAVTPAGFTSVEAMRVDVVADGAPPRVGALQNDQIDVPAEIVFKPEPRYTDEAQALGIEGTVVLEVEFSASNGVRVLRNNLVVTNHIALERPLRCRILLTSPLESFTIGRTIVLSRGLIDVLPDEASLATMIAHELAHVVLGHPLIDTKFAFADRPMVSDGELLQALQFHHPAREEADADERVMDMLAKSPYGDKLAAAGLFVRMIAQSAGRLPKLIQPHIGDQIAATGQMPRFTTLVAQAPALAPENLDQIPALSLGARVVVDPWSDRLTLDRSPALAPASIREKVPLAVTPLMPYLRYKDANGAPLSSR